MSDLLVKLYQTPLVTQLADVLADEGVTIRRAMAYEKHKVINWVAGTFGKGWASECEIAFSGHPITCHIAIEDQRIVGFACHDCTYKNFFGPLGVAEKAQGRSIGKALTLSALNAMEAAGYAYAIIGDAKDSEYYERVFDAIPIEDSEASCYPPRLLE